MLKLVPYEINKLLQKKILLVALLFFIVLDMINIYNIFSVYDFNLYTIPQEHQGPVQEDLPEREYGQQINYLTGTDDEKHEININHALYNAHHLLETQRNDTATIQNQLEQWNVTDKETYSYRKLEKQYEMLANLPIPYVFSERTASHVVNYIGLYGIIYVSIMIILAISTMFTSEYASSMDKLMKSSAKGKTSLVTAKIIAALIYATVIAIFFAFINMIPFMKMLFNYGIHVPIQNISPFELSPYAFTLGQYLLVQFGIYLLGAWILSLMVLLVSALSRSILTSLFVSGAIWAVPLVIEQYTYQIHIPDFLDYALNNLMRVVPLFRTYKTVNILGYPVLYPYMIIGLYLLLAPIIIYNIYPAFKKKLIH